jgi:hypothetical protein
MGVEMEFSEYLLLKAIALVVLAFAWGVYCGIKGLDLNGRHPSAGPSEGADQTHADPASRR